MIKLPHNRNFEALISDLPQAIALILMNTDELTQITTAHHNVISRHDVEMAEIRTTLNIVSHKLDEAADQFNQVADQFNQVAAQQDVNAQQIALNRQDIASLSAGILDLRNLAADYLQGRADH